METEETNEAVEMLIEMAGVDENGRPPTAVSIQSDLEQIVMCLPQDALDGLIKWNEQHKARSNTPTDLGPSGDAPMPSATNMSQSNTAEQQESTTSSSRTGLSRRDN